MIPSYTVLCLWTSSKCASPGKYRVQQSTMNNLDLSRRTKCLHLYHDARHSKSTHFGTNWLKVWPCFLVLPCNRACLHMGTSWIPVTNLTAKLCLEQNFSTSFYQTQLGVDAQPFNHVQLSPEENEDFTSSYVWDDKTKHGNTTWSAKPCALLHGWNWGAWEHHMRCRPRWACRGIQLGCLQMCSGRYPHKTAETLSLVVQRDTISVYFTHVSISQFITRQVFFFFSIPPFKKLIPSFLILSCIIKGTTNRDPAAGVKCLKTSADQSLEACLKQDTLMH